MAQRVSSPTFVGRQRELDRVLAAVGGARGGTPAVVLIAGEAGVGKTRFLREIAADSRRAGVRVLEGGSIPLGDGGLPFGPIIEAFRALPDQLAPTQLDELLGRSRGELARVMPSAVRSVDPPAPDSSQGQTFEQILLFIQRLAAVSPVLLALEDIHWADQTTLDFLVFMVRNLRDGPISVIATYRNDELHRRHPLLPVVAELERGGRILRVTLPRFDRHELAAQIEGILGREAEPEYVEAIHARSGGNAFFAEELIAAGDDAELPETFQEVLLARTATLSEPTQEIVRVAAAAGPRIRVAVLQQVAEADPRSLYAALREAVDGHVLLPIGDGQGDQYVFRHALLQEASYGDLLPGERTRLHAAYAQALGGDLQSDLGGSPAAELAYHWHAAHDLPRAFEASVRAGLAAEAMNAAGDARANYRRALELWDRVPDALSRSPLDRPELLVRTALLEGTPRPTAVAYVRAAIDLVDATPDAARAGMLRTYLAWLQFLCSDAAALTAAREAVSLIPTDPPSAARARSLLVLGSWLGYLDHHAESLPILEEALRTARAIAPEASAPGALATLGLDFTVPRRIESAVLEHLGVAVASLGDLDAGLRQIEASRAIASELAIHSRVNETWHSEALVLTEAGRLEDALARTLGSATYAVAHGLSRDQQAFSLMWAGRALYGLGRWPEAAASLEQAEGRAADMITLILLDAHTARLEVGQGEFGDAARRLKRRRGIARESLHPFLVATFVGTEAELALGTGDALSARRAVREALPRLEAAPDVWVGTVALLIALGIRAEADLAIPARARHAEDDLRDSLDGGGVLLARIRTLHAEVRARRPIQLPQADAWLATCEAEFARLEGNSDPERWAAAGAAWESLRMPYPHAYALMREAQAALADQAGRPRVARSVQAAYAIAERLGAVPLRRSLEEIAARGGVRLGSDASEPAGTRGESVSDAPRDLARGRYELTRRELEVLDLLAAGQSDGDIAARLFISKKTVSVHVANIKGKLGAESRVGVVTLAIGRGLIESPHTTRGTLRT